MFIIIIIVFILNILFFYISLFNVASKEYYVENFNENKIYFETIVDKCGDIYNKNTDSNLIVLNLEFKDNNYVLVLDNEIINLNTKQQKALKKISLLFDNDALLSRIHIEKNRIGFCTDGNKYALVYNKVGQKPFYMSVSDESINIKIRKINKYWYHVVSK